MDIAAFVARQPSMLAILRSVAALGLADCWVGAGFVRNVVWDTLHGRPWSASWGDIDVVYFDCVHCSPERDATLERALAASAPDLPWSVKNQARMHLRNGDAPYADTADALRHWPERCTAVAVRAAGGRVGLLAPFGIADLLALVVAPTPAFAGRPEAWRARLDDKQWLQCWPRLSVRWPDPSPNPLPQGEGARS